MNNRLSCHQFAVFVLHAAEYFFIYFFFGCLFCAAFSPWAWYRLLKKITTTLSFLCFSSFLCSHLASDKLTHTHTSTPPQLLYLSCSPYCIFFVFFFFFYHRRTCTLQQQSSLLIVLCVRNSPSFFPREKNKDADVVLHPGRLSVFSWTISLTVHWSVCTLSLFTF